MTLKFKNQNPECSDKVQFETTHLLAEVQGTLHTEPPEKKPLGLDKSYQNSQ